MNKKFYKQSTSHWNLQGKFKKDLSYWELRTKDPKSLKHEVSWRFELSRVQVNQIKLEYKLYDRNP